MLSDAKLVAFGAITDSARAVDFYGTLLGLTLRSNDEFALSFDANGVELRLQKVEQFTPHPFTSLGWHVANVTDVLRQLDAHGISAERYSWMQQDVLGVWEAPSGARVAWFKDPDGTLVSVAEYPGAE